MNFETDTETLKDSESDEETLKGSDCSSDNESDSQSEDRLTEEEEREVLEEDLRIFGYELFNYFMARFFCCCVNFPDVIPVTEDSKFTEEFGKAVIVIWHKADRKYIKQLHFDLPRYTCRTDNFIRYVEHTVKDIISDYENTRTQQLIKITAFLFDAYIFCAANNHHQYLPNFFYNWSKLILTYCDIVETDEGWEVLREECKEISKEYDQEKVEILECNSVIQVKMKYFIKVKCTELSYSFPPKVVSRFYILNHTYNSVLQNPVQFSCREETLYIIGGSTVQDEFFEVVRTAVDLRNVFLKPYIQDTSDKNLYKSPTNKPIDENQRRKKSKKKRRK